MSTETTAGTWLTTEAHARLVALLEDMTGPQRAHIVSRIEAARGRFGGSPTPEIQRAMNNLRAAIQVRLSKGELSPESLARFTAALDRAASEIEQS